MELISNGKNYIVPPYQRDYSWTEEQWEELWNDINYLLRNPQSSHYMGALVIDAKSDREFLIIDGQQRIATLSILALAIIDRLNILVSTGIDANSNQERSQRLRSKYVGEKDPASLIESTKLKLNRHDDPFYQDYLVSFRSPSNPRGLQRSNRLLWDAFKWFKSKLDELPDKNEGVALATLLDETVARKLLFILITVEDELNAYTVFETLNARGIELSSTDLIKNYLFSKIRVESDIETIQRRWQKLIDTVRQEKFPDFLRYYFLCEQPDIRKPRLFKYVRDKVVTPDNVITLLDRLDENAELYAAIQSPEHEFWIENPDAKPYIRELNLFKVSQMTPLLLVGWHKLEMQDFVRLLKLVSVISFRFSVIGQNNPNKLEDVYHSAARALGTGEISQLHQIFALLRRIYIEDEEFIRDFQLKSVKTVGPSRRLAKYILCKLEQDLSGRACDWSTDPSTIEHIVPENPTQSWNEVFQSEVHEKLLYRLGNLALLEPSLNREAGNRSFLEKKMIYERSHYRITSELASDVSSEEWSPATLNLRQTNLARRAAHIWKSDFA